MSNFPLIIAYSEGRSTSNKRTLALIKDIAEVPIGKTFTVLSTEGSEWLLTKMIQVYDLGHADGYSARKPAGRD